MAIDSMVIMLIDNMVQHGHYQYGYYQYGYYQPGY